MQMKALVLAAGEGKRLRSTAARGKSHSPKPLTPLLGLTLIERTLLTLRESGIKDIIVVTGFRGEEIKGRIGDGSKYGVRVTYVENEQWPKGNGSSVLAAKNILGEEASFLLLMSDHVMEPGAAKKLLGLKSLNSGEVAMLVDYNCQRVFRVDEATKVLVDGSRVRDIGKGLNSYNGVDCGVFLCTPGIFQALAEEADRGRYALSDGIQHLAEKGLVRAVDIGDSWWIDVDDTADLEEARRRLLQSLPSSRDGLISKLINRKVSVPISGFIASTGITPNIVSFANFLVAVASALAFVKGLWLWGGLLAQAASIIDGVDGEVARLKFKATKYGAYFDSILDRYGDALMIFGMTYGWYLMHPGLLVWLLGSAALIGSPMSMLGKEKFHALTGSPYLAEKFDGFLRFLPANRDGRLFLIMLGGLAGQIPIVLGVLALITNTLAVGRLLVVRRYFLKNF